MNNFFFFLHDITSLSQHQCFKVNITAIGSNIVQVMIRAYSITVSVT